MPTGNNAEKKPATPRGVSAFDPRAPALTQPYKRLVEEGFITSLTVIFTPNGVSMTAIPDARLAAVESSGLTADQAAPLGMCLAASDKGNLIPRRDNKSKKTKGGTSKPALPEKSLCKRDFEGTDPELYARAQAVCTATGGAPLVGRVRSAGAFDGTVSTSFENWWKGANVEQRLSAVIIPSRAKELTTEEKARLGNMRCPFRGNAGFVVAEEEEEEDQPAKARSSSSILSN